MTTRPRRVVQSANFLLSCTSGGYAQRQGLTRSLVSCYYLRQSCSRTYRTPNERQKRDLCHPETCREIDLIDQCYSARHKLLLHNCDGSRKLQRSASVRYLIHSQLCYIVNFRVNESGAATCLLTVAQRVSSLLKPCMGVWNLPKVGSGGVSHRYQTCLYVQ